MSKTVEKNDRDELLNRLHHLRWEARVVKTQADKMGLLRIAVLCAGIVDETTRAIETINEGDKQHGSKQGLGFSH